MTHSLHLKVYRRLQAINVPSDFCMKLLNHDPQFHLAFQAFLAGHATLIWNQTTGELKFIPREEI